MNFSIVESVKVSRETGSNDVETELRQTLLEELRRISLECHESGEDCIEVVSVNATFGSILRNDNTRVKYYPNRSRNGYTLVAEVNYRPSVWFWIFLAIDILLVETIIGFVIGIALTLGIYFYHKKIVAESLRDALRNVVKTIE